MSGYPFHDPMTNPPDWTSENHARARRHDEPHFKVYRLVGGPLDGEQAEAPDPMPQELAGELWRYTGSGELYALYRLDAFAGVFRWADTLATRDQLMAVGDRHAGVLARVDRHVQGER